MICELDLGAIEEDCEGVGDIVIDDETSVSQLVRFVLMFKTIKCGDKADWNLKFAWFGLLMKLSILSETSLVLHGLVNSEQLVHETKTVAGLRSNLIISTFLTS